MLTGRTWAEQFNVGNPDACAPARGVAANAPPSAAAVTITDALLIRRRLGRLTGSLSAFIAASSLGSADQGLQRGKQLRPAAEAARRQPGSANPPLYRFVFAGDHLEFDDEVPDAGHAWIIGPVAAGGHYGGHHENWARSRGREAVRNGWFRGSSPGLTRLR